MSKILHTHYLTCMERSSLDLSRSWETNPPGRITNSIFRKRRYILKPNVDKHMMWGNIKVVIEDTLLLEDRGFAQVVVEGESSPLVSWNYGPEASMTDYFSIVMCGGLARHEVTGDTSSRMVYDLFWQGLSTSSEMRKWIKKHVPHWHKLVKDQFDKLGEGEQHEPGCDLFLPDADERGLTCSCSPSNLF